ncbi:unnamed protein product [Adineta steineri]|uniref:Uncharacterized protein n=1 Tax=Adineta steineri TaxID=433720 RepID=A0A819M0R0_9BILA|nr:unnamed protein product [Adineta steineri]CAF3971933.1 unnamed protein product [Adineta steineri]
MLFASQNNDNSTIQVPLLTSERRQELHDGLPFALTSDLRRSSQRVHYISLTGHIFTNTYETVPAVLGCLRIIDRNVSTNIERYITFDLNRLQIKPEQITSITTRVCM